MKLIKRQRPFQSSFTICIIFASHCVHDTITNGVISERLTRYRNTDTPIIVSIFTCFLLSHSVCLSVFICFVFCFVFFWSSFCLYRRSIWSILRHFPWSDFDDWCIFWKVSDDNSLFWKKMCDFVVNNSNYLTKTVYHVTSRWSRGPPWLSEAEPMMFQYVPSMLRSVEMYYIIYIKVTTPGFDFNVYWTYFSRFIPGKQLGSLYHDWLWHCGGECLVIF